LSSTLFPYTTLFRSMDITHGEFVGTPNFASPEQFGSGPVDARSDIYSLGTTLWFALTGKTPFAGRNIEEIRRAQKLTALPTEQLKAAHVPRFLRSLLKSMLALEPAGRPGVHDLAARLRGCSGPASNVRRIRFAIASTVILILGPSAFFIFHSVRTHPPTVESVSNPAVLEKSVAVLPFDNQNRDPDIDYLSDGITESIIHSLSQLSQVKVMARSTVFQYKDIEDDRNYALAYAGFADAYANLGANGYIAPIDGTRKTEKAAREAVALDENLAEAHAALALAHIAFAPCNFQLGDRELRRAIELS